MVAIDMDISLSLDLVMGATAAMALPPHIAVPADMRYVDVFGSFIHLPKNQPITSTAETETIVINIPSLPDCKASCTFIPKPNPTTDICSRFFDIFFDTDGSGLPKTTAKTIPAKSPTTGLVKTVAIATSTNNIDFILAIISPYFQ